MRLRLSSAIVGLALGLLVSLPAAGSLAAQAAATGTCKDGTTTTAKTKSGACRGHGGVATWTGAASAASASSTKPKSTSGTAKTSSTKTSSKKANTPSAGASETPAASGIPCADGTISKSKSRSGACRGHGGIQKEGAAPASSNAKPAANASAGPAPAPASALAPASAPAPAPKPVSAAAPANKPTPTANAVAPGTPGTAPEGATALCKDGTYSKSKHHTGSCAHHGGVAQWLDGSH
jgi:hypothetical protein